MFRVNYFKAGLPYQTRISLVAVALDSLVENGVGPSVSLNALNQSGAIKLAISGVGAVPSSCILERARVTDAASALFGLSPSPVSAPLATTFPFGFIDFRLAGCALGASQTITVQYPYPLPPKSAIAMWKRWDSGGSSQVLKFGSPGLPPDFTVSGNTITYTVTDGGAGDMDGIANGKIVDPAGVGLSCDLDINGDGQVTATKDGVLLNRFLLGFRGEALIAGVPLGAARANAQAVEDFIGSAMKYDIFGRPSLAANSMQDGLILTRLMLGLPDAALLNGVAIPADAFFTSAPDVRGNVNTRCGTLY